VFYFFGKYRKIDILADGIVTLEGLAFRTEISFGVFKKIKMGQDIKYIALHKNNKIPKEVIHFFENDSVIIPIDLYDGDFENLMNKRVNFQFVEDVFNFILNELTNEDSVIDTINSLKLLRVNTFFLTGYREILEIPQKDFWIIAKNGDLIESKGLVDPHKLIGLGISSHEIIMNEKRYYSYDDAFYEYHKNHPEKKLIRRYE